jgi:vacuolar protein sorting-associated protein 29
MQTRNKMNHVLCTGNIGNKETLEWLKGFSSNFTVVRGDQDDVAGLASETKKISIRGLDFGLVHGH